MRSIFFRELSAFFSSIVGYVAVIVFLVACWFVLWIAADTNMMDYGYASMDRFFDMAPWLLMLLIPAITMRSLSDEFRAGTIEWLSTKPLRDTDIILGKYFAALALIVFALLPTLIYLYSIHTLAVAKTTLDTGSITGSYIGLFFLAAAFAAIGTFCSSLTANQVVAFLLALVGCFMLYSGFEALSKLPAFAGGPDYYLSLVGLSFHYTSISRGVVDSRDVIYFTSVVVLFVALTRLSLARRTWA